MFYLTLFHHHRLTRLSSRLISNSQINNHFYISGGKRHALCLEGYKVQTDTTLHFFKVHSRSPGHKKP